MEYATREQAQQAVNQLSNQNLMGRLVYVREVGETQIRPGGHYVKPRVRIVRRNPGSSVPPAVAVADSLAALAAACQEDSTLGLLGPLEAEAVAVPAVRSMLLTSVPDPHPLSLLALPIALMLTLFIAPLQHWLAGSKGSLPTSQ